MSAEWEDELIRKIGAYGIADAPEGWQRIDLLVRVGYTHQLAIVWTRLGENAEMFMKHPFSFKFRPTIP